MFTPEPLFHLFRKWFCRTFFDKQPYAIKLAYGYLSKNVLQKSLLLIKLILRIQFFERNFETMTPIFNECEIEVVSENFLDQLRNEILISFFNQISLQFSNKEQFSQRRCKRARESKNLSLN